MCVASTLNHSQATNICTIKLKTTVNIIIKIYDCLWYAQYMIQFEKVNTHNMMCEDQGLLRSRYYYPLFGQQYRPNPKKFGCERFLQPKSHMRTYSAMYFVAKIHRIFFYSVLPVLYWGCSPLNSLTQKSLFYLIIWALNIFISIPVKDVFYFIIFVRNSISE